jgi:hypothetical protein
MELKFNVQKKHLAVFILVVVVVVLGFVVAQAPADQATHAGDKIYLTSGETLQAFIDAGSFGGGGVWVPGTDPGEITYSGGNVGIGTPNPEQSLHVQGNGLLTTGSGNGIYFRDRSGGAGDNWAWYSANNIARLWRQGGSDFISVTQGGDVGIGLTPTSGAKLDVAGTVRSGGLNVLGLASANVLGVGTSTPSAVLEVFNLGGGNSFKVEQGGSNLLVRKSGSTGTIVENSAGNLLLNPTTGNVGIRTTNPVINLAIGDSDTGLKWVSDGRLQVYSNNDPLIEVTPTTITTFGELHLNSMLRLARVGTPPYGGAGSCNAVTAGYIYFDNNHNGGQRACICEELDPGAGENWKWHTLDDVNNLCN